MERFSKKRQAILDCLRGTKTHPTAEWVFEQLRPQDPALSLATVYRNLRQLREAGLIRSVGTVDGQERYDANVSAHPHGVCRICGAVLDLEDAALPALEPPQWETADGFLIEEITVQSVGLCRRCKEKERSEKNGQ